MAFKGPFPSPTVDPPHRRPAQFPVTGRGEGDPQGQAAPAFGGRPAPPSGPPPSGGKRKAASKNLAMLQAILGKGKGKAK